MEVAVIQEAEKFRYLILAVQRLGNRQLHDYLEEVEVTPSQAEVIRVLEQWQPLSLKELGSYLVCETGSPSRLIDRMIQDDLIKRLKNPDDSRFVRLELTDKGKQKAFGIRQIEKELYHMLETLVSPSDFRETNRVLAKLLRQFPISETLARRGLIEDG